MPERVIWSDASKEILRKMFHCNCTVEEMAKVTRRPPGNVRAALSRMGLKLSEREPELNMEAYAEIMRRRVPTPQEE